MNVRLFLSLYVIGGLFVAIPLTFALRGGEEWDGTEVIIQLTVAIAIVLTFAQAGAAYWSTLSL
jgi:hypothetical protein